MLVNRKDDYTRAQGFNPKLRQYIPRVPGTCGLTLVYKISPPLDLASWDIACSEWNWQLIVNCMYAHVHTLSPISTQESSQTNNWPVSISKSIYSLNSLSSELHTVTTAQSKCASTAVKTLLLFYTRSYFHQRGTKFLQEEEQAQH